MKINLNGQARDFTKGTTVFQLIKQLNLKADLVVVELNQQILKKNNWEQTVLKEKDAVELISYIAGGRR